MTLFNVRFLSVRGMQRKLVLACAQKLRAITKQTRRVINSQVRRTLKPEFHSLICGFVVQRHAVQQTSCLDMS